jgi:hypothetical protein
MHLNRDNSNTRPFFLIKYSFNLYVIKTTYLKKISVFLILMLACSGGCKTSKHLTENKSTQASVNSGNPISTVTEPASSFAEQSTWLLGYIAPGQLTQPPYSTWYLTGYDEYQYNSDALKKLAAINLSDISIKVVFGTWCSDSRREVPRFMRILYVWNFPVSKVLLIGVDDKKQSPVDEYASLGIQRVPTFIIYKNKIEAGRIIENPKTSLEQDLLNILT